MIDLKELQFENQLLAGEKLIEILPNNFDVNDCILVGIMPRSVIITDYVSKKLGLNYEIMFCEPIFAPYNPECIIGMVSETEEVVVYENLINSFDITLGFVYGEAQRKYEEKILKNIYKYRKGNLLGELANKNILLIDDGCETGLSAEVCAKTLLYKGAKSISYLTPLISDDIANELNVLMDKIYVVHRIANFVDVDFYYTDKIEPNPEIIMSILEESSRYIPFIKGEKNANKD